VPELETHRLLVRDFRADDFDDVRRILDEESGFPPFSSEARRDWLDWTMQSYGAFASLYQPPWGDRGVCLKATGELVGVVGYTTMFHPLAEILEGKSAAEAHWQPEMGLFWAFSAGQRGRGYATEAARALIDFAFAAFSLKRIVASTDFDNTASQAVMRKLGMTLHRNDTGRPEWYEILGVLRNPG
jgi:RimJ/RimL family protein N-acetyltransferase